MAMLLSPSKRRQAPPRELPVELIGEILLRLPPDDPGCLVRASAVCRTWRDLISDPAFLPRFRAFHRRPPILGFLSSVFDRRFIGATFVSTSAFTPPPRDLRGWSVLDSRHGRVFLHNTEAEEEGLADLVVWDPITDEERGFPLLGPRRLGPHNAAVLCAVDGCDHLDCHGGPFHAVFLCTDILGLTSAFVYSSASGEWSNPDEQAPLDNHPDTMPTLLIGNTLFFLCEFSSRVMQYDLDESALSVIDLPRAHEGRRVALMTAEDGGLGFAVVLRSNIHLWSREPGPDGAEAWVQRRIIELGTLLPADALGNSLMLAAIGFAEGVGVIFVRTVAGVFTVEPRSLEWSRVSDRTDIDSVYPYMSFYTPDHAKRLMALP